MAGSLFHPTEGTLFRTLENVRNYKRKYTWQRAADSQSCIVVIKFMLILYETNKIYFNLSALAKLPVFKGFALHI